MSTSLSREVVRVDDESSPAHASTKKVVASVSDDQAQVVLCGELDALLDMLGCPRYDGENWIVAHGARVSGICCRPTGVVGEVCPQCGGGQVDSVSVVSKPNVMSIRLALRAQ